MSIFLYYFKFYKKHLSLFKNYYMKNTTKSSFHKSLLFVLFLAVSLVSCSETQSVDAPLNNENDTVVSAEPFLEMYNDLMIPGSGLLFRGVDFDMSRTEIRKIEMSRSECSETESEKENQLIITTDLGSETLDFADIKYTFDEKGVYYIEAETYAITKEKADYLFNEVKYFYSSSLGEGVLAEDGYLEFKGSNKRYKYQVAMKEIVLEATETEQASYGMYLLFSMK